MSVLKSDEKMLTFPPFKFLLLKSFCLIYYQAFDPVFHHQMKHPEVRQKYSAARRIFNSLLSVLSGDAKSRILWKFIVPNY